MELFLVQYEKGICSSKPKKVGLHLPCAIIFAGDLSILASEVSESNFIPTGLNDGWTVRWTGK